MAVLKQVVQILHLLHFHCLCAGVRHPHWQFPGATIARRFFGEHLYKIEELQV